MRNKTSWSVRLNKIALANAENLSRSSVLSKLLGGQPIKIVLLCYAFAESCPAVKCVYKSLLVDACPNPLPSSPITLTSV